MVEGPGEVEKGMVGGTGIWEKVGGGEARRCLRVVVGGMSGRMVVVGEAVELVGRGEEEVAGIDGDTITILSAATRLYLTKKAIISRSRTSLAFGAIHCPLRN